MRKFDLNRHIVKTQRKAFKAARNLFRISAENFDLGTIDTEYLLSSYGTYVEQELSYLKALFDRNNSYFDYLQINGQSIFKK